MIIKLVKNHSCEAVDSTFHQLCFKCKECERQIQQGMKFRIWKIHSFVNDKLGEQFVFNDNELLCYVNCGHKRIKTEDFSGIAFKILIAKFYRKDIFNVHVRPNLSSNRTRDWLNSIQRSRSSFLWNWWKWDHY